MNIPRFLRRESQPQFSRDELNTQLESIITKIQLANDDLESLPVKLREGHITPGDYTLTSQYLEQYRDGLLAEREKVLSRIDKLGSIAADAAFRQK